MTPNAMRGTILVAVLILAGAIILGLNNRNVAPTAAGGAVEEATPTPDLAEVATPDVMPTPTVPADLGRSPSQVRVQVANGSGLDGVAGRLTQTLAGAGYTTGEPTNASSPVQSSTLFYEPGYEGDAAAVLGQFGLADVVATQPMPDPPPGVDYLDPNVNILIVVGPDDLSTS